MFKYTCSNKLPIMLKKKDAQGLSITTIIVAVIGLIVLVVLIAVFTGRIGTFGKGLEAANSCQSACSAFGWKPTNEVAATCLASDEKYIPGKFKDTDIGCCCEKP